LLVPCVDAKDRRTNQYARRNKPYCGMCTRTSTRVSITFRCGK
jgi:hypothetical protein